MKSIAFAFFIACVTIIASCSYNEPFYVLNSSDEEIVLESSGVEYTIVPGSTTKIRGLHYNGATISNTNAEFLYRGALTDIRRNWDDYRDTYICAGFLGPKINVEFTSDNELLLLPCREVDSVKLIPTDRDIAHATVT